MGVPSPILLGGRKRATKSDDSLKSRYLKANGEQFEKVKYNSNRQKRLTKGKKKSFKVLKLANNEI